MKIVILSRFAAIIFALTFILATQVKAQDQQEAMKAWQEYMTPGDVHGK